MAAIFGTLSAGPPTRSALVRMGLTLAHRGRGETCIRIGRRCALGCIPTAAAEAPATAGDRERPDTLFAVYDGAIYNTVELRAMLDARGRPVPDGAVETLLCALYREYGAEFVRLLRGMFAIALRDSASDRLILARDPLGQKPLFYTRDRDKLLFASELKALTAIADEAPRIDNESMFHYLSLRFVPAPGTMLRGYSKLPPATILLRERDDVRMIRYWRPAFRDKIELPDGEYLDRLEEKLTETVSAHCAGPGPVGAFLSGGLDSGLIVASMARALEPGFPTFSVGSGDPEFDELPQARQVAAHYGTAGFETRAGPELVRRLPQLLWHLDEPSDPVAGAKYLAADLAAAQVPVVLGGDGGDELFAGFDRYRGVRLAGWYARMPAALRDGVIAPLADRVPSTFGYDNVAQKFQWMNRLAHIREPARRFAEGVAFFRFSEDEKRALFTADVWQQVRHLDSRELLVNTYAEAEAGNEIERMLYTDYCLRLPEHSLMLTDRTGMAHGLEIRSPLVDRELVEVVAAFPLRMKVRGNRAKYIERQLARRLLPAAISQRRKQGFRLPLAAWFAQELHPLMHRVFTRSTLADAGVIDREFALRLLEAHRQRRDDHHSRLWMLLNLELWHQSAVLRRDSGEIAAWMEDGVPLPGTPPAIST